MNAICTICAKNYLSHAKTLGNSIKKFHPQVEFYIMLSDEQEGFDIKCSEFNLIEAREIGIPDYYQLAFKYDVIEFSTSVKPFFLEYLFANFNYDKILYLDPDMVVYGPLDYLFNKLDMYTALLTPHIIKPYIKNNGATTEEEALFVGIYNLGFFGIKNNEIGRYILSWWKEKLYDQCYADKEDALHVDQRWMDYLPALYGDDVCILRHPGVNHAFWNFHERAFTDTGNSYKVDGDELLIFHFSGFDTEDPTGICRKQVVYSLNNLPQYKRIFQDYLTELKKNDLYSLSVMRYKYNNYDNGVSVIKYQRRLFRALLKAGKYSFINPFTTNAGSFYELLVKNGLMIYDKSGELIALKKRFTNHEKLFQRMYKLLRFFKSLIGIRRYYLLIRFMTIHHRFENQLFLIKDVEK